MRVVWTCWFLKPPSTGRVFDFIAGSLYFGLSIWICMSLLNLRFSQISFCAFLFPLIPMNLTFPTPSSTCRAFDFICVSLYVGLLIWMCMSFLNRRSSQISCCLFIFSTSSYEHEIPDSIVNVSCFWCHMRFPLLWLTDFDLYVFFEFTIFQKSIVSY